MAGLLPQVKAAAAALCRTLMCSVNGHTAHILTSNGFEYSVWTTKCITCQHLCLTVNSLVA